MCGRRDEVRLFIPCVCLLASAAATNGPSLKAAMTPVPLWTWDGDPIDSVESHGADPVKPSPHPSFYG